MFDTIIIVGDGCNRLPVPPEELKRRYERAKVEVAPYLEAGRPALEALERRGREEGWLPSGGAVSDGSPHGR